MKYVPAGVTLVVVFAATVAAQRGQPPPRQPSSQGPVFRAATQYVAMDVIVRDKDDRPVTDQQIEYKRRYPRIYLTKESLS